LLRAGVMEVWKWEKEAVYRETFEFIPYLNPFFDLTPPLYLKIPLILQFILSLNTFKNKN